MRGQSQSTSSRRHAGGARIAVSLPRGGDFSTAWRKHLIPLLSERDASVRARANAAVDIQVDLCMRPSRVRFDRTGTRHPKVPFASLCLEQDRAEHRRPNRDAVACDRSSPCIRKGLATRWTSTRSACPGKQLRRVWHWPRHRQSPAQSGLTSKGKARSYPKLGLHQSWRQTGTK